MDLAQAVLFQFLLYLLTRSLMGNLKDKIRNASDIDSEVVEIPQWGQAKIEVRSMSAKARAQMLRAVAPDGNMNMEAMYPSILVACCYDPDSGERLFDESDMGWINEKASGPIEKLAQVAMRISGLTQESLDEGKDGS